MSSPSETVTPEVLREWGMPDPGNSKKTRGRVMVVGGSRRSPGAILLAGEAALRVGAGRLGLVVPLSIEAQIGVVIREAAVFSLPEQATDPIDGHLRDELAAAGAVLVGPGFDEPDETRATLEAIADIGVACLVLDAFGLGVLPDIDRTLLPDTLILNPNEEEAALLLGRELRDDRAGDLLEIAERYDAVVNCYGHVVSPSGESWRVSAGGSGLGTSGSGDVLAGAIAGLAARGLSAERAAVWASWTHASAGDRLTEHPGLGFLAGDLARELTPVMNGVLGEFTSV
ncbi:ADP-dependent NAD(P)H-hydrate dehydratase [Microbacterium lacus]|uniref:ADP-dependent NAD(P)H-hydrate dehydratase n=1 Tax=Microbacterium lacus TaxID=415217 RepID=UPI000C2C26D4|nr:ADP/ATP-dependent (S)-NAD(P)H-hydrate dehydratase [Microbacterium lacus]